MGPIKELVSFLILLWQSTMTMRTDIKRGHHSSF